MSGNETSRAQYYDKIDQIYGYVVLSIVIIGVLGNILTLIVFQKGKRCSNSWCALYFKALAVADICVLLSKALMGSLSSLHVKDTWDGSWFECVFFMFNQYFCIQVSTWITVTLTLDRAISVNFPTKGRNIAKLKWVCTKIAIVIVVCTGINIPACFMVWYDIENNACRYVYDSYRSGLIHAIISHGVLVCLLPGAIIIACNVTIIRVLYRRASGASQMGLSERHVASRRGDANTVMYRVIAIGVVHLVSTVPAAVVLIINGLRGFKVITYKMITSYELELTYVARAVVFLSSGVNCLVYGLSGSDFRRDLKDLTCTSPARRNRSMLPSRGHDNLSRTDTSTV